MELETKVVKKPKVRKVRSLTFQALREANVKRTEDSWHRVTEWSAAEWLMCVTGELGELAGLLKHYRRGENLPAGSLGEELADVVIYLDLLAASLGVDLDLAIIRKFNTTSEKVGSKHKLRKG